VVAGYRAALASLSREDHLERWGGVQVNLADARITQGRANDEAALREAIQLLEGVLAAVSKEQHRKLWAAAQERLGTALSLLHTVLQRSQGAASKGLLMRASDAHRAALTVLTREQDGVLWASAHASLGGCLFELMAADHVIGVNQRSSR
jgi:hypothetical protein